MENSLRFALKTVPSKLRVTGGREIPFVRAVLLLRNTGGAAVSGVVARAELSEERGLVHDATEAMKRAAPADSLPPGGELAWDVYDLLLAAHAGVASKVRLWGHKAILNGRIELSARADCMPEGAAAPLQTPVARWRLRWQPSGPAAEEVELAVEAL
jgi:hypothetical protein